MTGAVRPPTAQDVFWEWIAVQGEPWAQANGYKRRGKKGEFYRRVDRLELVITVVRSIKSTRQEITAWLDGYVLDVPSDRLRRSLRTRQEASGHRFIVFSLAVRAYTPGENTWQPTYGIVSGARPEAWPAVLPQDLDTYRVELEAIAALPNRRRGVFIRPRPPSSLVPDPRPQVVEPGRWYQSSYAGVRTFDGRNTDRAVALIGGLDLPAAAERLGKQPGDLRLLDHDPDPLPPDDYGAVFWRHPDDVDTPIWHEGNARWWTPPFSWTTAPEAPTVQPLPPASTIANPDITRYSAAADATTRHALVSDRRRTLCGLDASGLRRLSALFVLGRDENCSTCEALAQGQVEPPGDGLRSEGT